MKKLFYLASGIILCTSLMPIAANAHARGILLTIAEFKENVKTGKTIRTCKNKVDHSLVVAKSGTYSKTKFAVKGRRFTRIFANKKGAEAFFKVICAPLPKEVYQVY